MLGLFLLYVMFSTPFFQTRLVNYITQQIEQQTGVKISIGSVNFRPIESIVLHDVYVQDTRNDTLLYCQRIAAQIDSVSFVRRHLTITKLNLNKAHFNLWTKRDSTGGETNIEMLLKRLPRAKDTTRSNPWKIGLHEIQLRNSRFRYQESEYEARNYGINWTDVECNALNVNVSDISWENGNYHALVEGLNFKEKSGFQVLQMGGNVNIWKNRMLITNTTIQTAKSNIHLDTLLYNWVPDQKYWKYFTDKMQQYYVFTNSSVNFDDLAYFNGQLLGMHNTVRGSGVVYNTIHQLEGKNLDLYIGENSRIKGAFSSKGLPRFRETDFNLALHDCQVVPAELEILYLPWIETHYLKFPEAVHRAGIYSVDGEFNGRIEDFSVKIESTTPAARGNISLAYQVDSTHSDRYRYGGQINLYHVDYQLFSGTSFLGNGNLYGNFNGEVADSLSLFNLSGRAGHIEIGGAPMHNLYLSIGSENDKIFMLSSLNNKHVKSNIMVYGQDSLKHWRVQGMVSAHHWDSIGLELLGPEESLYTVFSGDYRSGWHESELTLQMSDTRYKNRQGAFYLDSVKITNRTWGEYNDLTVQSPLVNLNIEGFWELNRYKDLWHHIVYSYFPAYEKAEDRQLPTKTNVLAHVELTNVNPLLQVISPALRLSPGSLVKGSYNHANKKINLIIETDTLSFGELQLQHSRINLTGDEKNVECIYRADKLSYANWGEIYNVKNTTKIQRNYIDNDLTWSNWGQETYSGRLAMDLRLLEYRNRHLAQINVRPSLIIMADSIWNVERSMILWEEKDLYVNNFEIRRGEQCFRLRGRLSEHPRDTLSVIFNHFNLSEFNNILFDSSLKIFGQINGQINVRDFYHDRLIVADMNVKQWGINQDSLGNIRMHSYWDAPSKSLLINVENRMADKTPLQLNGYYKPSADSLLARLELTDLDVKHITSYFPDLLKDGNGSFSGNLLLSNSNDHSEINGSLHLDSVSLTLRGLNTAFMVNDTLRINRNRLEIEQFNIIDAEGEKAACSGFYDLDKDRYDLNVQCSNFKILNTRQGQGEPFYGQLYISGQARLHNIGGHNTLSTTLRPEPNSVLYIPLTTAMNQDENNFLLFVDQQGQIQVPSGDFQEINHSVQGIDLQANLELNDNLEVQLIFDPTIGDVLRTVGSGDIRVSINKDEELSVFGEYNINQGDYLFTLSNLLNKRFVLMPGGTITWNGSPYDALINVSASYNVKTSLNDLLSGTTSMLDRNTKVPVECVLNLTDNLSNPNVQFSIDFPSLDTQVKSLLQSLFSSQDEVNKQVFALLVMNKFYTPDYVEKDPTQEERNAGYQMGVTTASELLSNQLSRWLSQISSNVDVGFSYRPGDEVTTDEFELALSTQIFNNRVTISANGNMGEKAKTNSNTSITGDFDVEVKLNPQGTLRLKAYSHTDEKLVYNATETVQGVGISYQESFDTFKELWKKYFHFLHRKRTAR